MTCCPLTSLATRSLVADGEMLAALAEVMLALLAMDQVLVLRGDPARQKMLVEACITRAGRLGGPQLTLATPGVGAGCVEIPVLRSDGSAWGVLFGVGEAPAERSELTLPFCQLLGRLVGACFEHQERGRMAGVVGVAAQVRAHTASTLTQLREHARAFAEAPELPGHARGMAEGIVSGVGEVEQVISALNTLRCLREIDWGHGLESTLDLGEVADAGES
jgi:hypothetical protein